jgi:hypothetical protein
MFLQAHECRVHIEPVAQTGFREGHAGQLLGLVGNGDHILGLWVLKEPSIFNIEELRDSPPAFQSSRLKGLLVREEATASGRWLG